MELKTDPERQMFHIAMGVICLLYKQDSGPTRAEKVLKLLHGGVQSETNFQRSFS